MTEMFSPYLFPLVFIGWIDRQATHTRTHAHSHARTHARTHAHSHARTHARTHTHSRARTHARTHAHIHLSIFNIIPP